MTAQELMALIKSRRVVRAYTGDPVSDEALAEITEAGRWATSGGNQHLHKFLIVRDPVKIRMVRSLSPGMLVTPPAMILILTDRQRASQEAAQIERDHIPWIDVGTAAMNMALQAHAMGLGSCPVTSFSRSGVAAMLDLPGHLTPEFIMILGHPAPERRERNPNAPKGVTARDLTYWERAGNHEP